MQRRHRIVIRYIGHQLLWRVRQEKWNEPDDPNERRQITEVIKKEQHYASVELVVKKMTTEEPGEVFIDEDGGTQKQLKREGFDPQGKLFIPENGEYTGKEIGDEDKAEEQEYIRMNSADHINLVSEVFLQDEEIPAAAIAHTRIQVIKFVLAAKLKVEMETKQLTETQMAGHMKVSLAQLDCVLKNEKNGVTIETLVQAADVVGMWLSVTLHEKE